MRKISFIILMMIPLLSFAQSVELSKNAEKNFEIKTTVTDKKNVTLPRDALVVSRDEYYIYIKNGNSYEQQQIFPTKVTKDTVSFTLDTVQEREFVISGAPYLRIIFLNGSESE